MSELGEATLAQAGIELQKLQEIPLPNDPQEQALERARVEALEAHVSNWMDLRMQSRWLTPVMVRCDWCDSAFPQTQIRARLVRGQVGVLACTDHAGKTPQEWIKHLTGKR